MEVLDELALLFERGRPETVSTGSVRVFADLELEMDRGGALRELDAADFVAACDSLTFALLLCDGS